MRIELLRRFFMIVALLLVVTLVQGSLPTGRPDTLFLSDEILSFELRSDFTSIKADTSADPLFHDGKLFYHEPGGKTHLSNHKSTSTNKNQIASARIVSGRIIGFANRAVTISPKSGFMCHLFQFFFVHSTGNVGFAEIIFCNSE